MKKKTVNTKEYNNLYNDEQNPFKRLRLSTQTDGTELKQSELSEIFQEQCDITITQNQISKLENGTIKDVPKYILNAYRQVFGVSTDYLLGFTNMRTVDLEMQRVSFVTGLSEKSLIVLDYLRKFKGVTNTATGLINYSTIKILNKILESYYQETLSAIDNYFSDKRFNNTCYVETIFSLMDDYFNSSDAVCSIENKEAYFTHNNSSRRINVEGMYELYIRELLLREMDKLRDSMKEGDAND